MISRFGVWARLLAASWVLVIVAGGVVPAAGIVSTPPSGAGRQDVSAGPAGPTGSSGGDPAAVGGLPAPAQVAQAGPREYSYDAAGQLVGTVDPAVGAARHRYDEAGNLLQTERLGLDELAVFAVVPARGPVGTTVEISGTGFAAEAGDNVVEFDGVPAEVSSGGGNRISVVVPEGTTDGVVTVAANGQTATSPRPFIVEAGTPPPVITELSTDRGNRQEVVTITGTGFDPVPENNVVRFHRTVARVQEASPTSLIVRVPDAAASGAVSVRTAGGTAVSDGDFLIAPRGFRMADLVPAGRLAVGDGPLPVTVPAGMAALVLVDGTVGERISLSFTGNTIPVRSAMWMFTPYGGNFARGTLGDPLDLWTGNDLHQDLPAFDTSGAYAMVIEPNDGEAGSVVITASDVLVGDQLIADGSGVPFQIVEADQPAEFAFQATAGQWLSLGMTDISEPENTIRVRATAPDGQFIAWEAPLTQYTPTMVFKPWQSGTWTLSIMFGSEFGPEQLGFGRVWLSTVIEASELVIDGEAVQAEITRPGQSVRLPFAGTAGQDLQLGFTENTLQAHNRPALPSTIMAEPDDDQVELRTGWEQTRDIPTLLETGEYSIFVTGWLAVGTVKTWLSTPAEAGQIEVNTKKQVTVDRPGRDVWLDYQGVQGEPLYLTTTDRALPGEVTLRLRRPDGTLLNLGRRINELALPVTGTYRIQVDPESPGMGSLSVVAVQPLNVGTLTPDADPTPADLTLPGQRIAASFDWQVGQQLTIAVIGPVDWYTVRIYDASNTQVYFTVELLGRGMDIDRLGLPASGSYRIEAAPDAEATGEFSVMLYSEVDGGALEIDGPPVNFDLEKPNQNGRVSFTAAEGDALEFEVDGVLWSALSYYTLTGPDGTVLVDRTFILRRVTALTEVSAAGTYTISFDVPGGQTGQATVSLRRVAATAGESREEPPRQQTDPRPAAPPCPTEPETSTAPAAPAPVRAGQPATVPEPAPEPPVANGCVPAGWTPGQTHLDGQGWTTAGPPPTVRDRALEFPVGLTGVVGRVLDTTDRPLGGVTVSVADTDTKVVTDDDGRFALTGTPAGHVALRVDGRTAGRPGRQYGVFDIGVQVNEGSMLVLPYTVFLPALDSRGTVQVESPTTGDVVLTTPAIPGLEVHIPAGTVVRDADGDVVRELNLTAVPIDRPPFPLPPTKVPVYFTLQPGGGVLFPDGARIVYPNYTKEPAGTRTHFWNYDPNGKGWHLYGLGTVSEDGTQIIPDPDVKFYRLTGAMTAVPRLNPPPRAPRPGTPRVGDPVDPATGLLAEEMVDLTIDDVMPIEIKRSYQQADPDVRAFGIGMNFDYGMFPWSPGTIGEFDFQEFDLVQPDGSRIHYTRTTPGTDYAGAVFTADPTPTQYDGSTVAWNGDGWDVTLRDGSVIVLGDEAPMQEIRDKYGNVTTITRATAAPGIDGKVRQLGAIKQITSPSGRWVRFGYDANNPPRITSIEDNIGRRVTYTYAPSGHLETVTKPDGGVTTYTWDAEGRLESITDGRGNTYNRNEYDDQGRVILQEAADGGITTFDYVTVDDQVTETTMTDPEGNIRRFTFNPQGQVLTDTRAFGTGLEQTITNVYDESGARVVQTIDALGRSTTYTYDELGQVAQLTRLAGTDQARTEVFERDGPFGELTSYTDEYGNQTIYTLDDRGAVVEITDPLGRTTLFDVNASGLITTVTDPLGNTTIINYAAADPIRSVDPLGRITTTAFDAAGRPVRVTDPRGAAIDTAYEVTDQVASVTDPLGRTTSFGYDLNGNLITVTDPRGGITTTDYDQMDLVSQIVDPLGAAETMDYDLNGNLVTHTSRRGVVTEHDYDELDRRIISQYGDQDTVTYTYDAADRLIQTDDTAPGAGTITVDYDGLDRVITETSPHGQVTYSYAPDSPDRTMTVDGAAPVRHEFDANGDLTGIWRGEIQVTAITRDLAGRPDRTGGPGDAAHQSYIYTDAGEVASIGYLAGGNQFADLSYEYDAGGLPVATTGSMSQGELPAAFGPATYDAANRLTSIGVVAVQYDADGNLTFDGQTSYTWDARGRLSGLTRDGVMASFGYATDGRRLDRTVNDLTTNYLYDGSNPLQEKVDGAVTATMTSTGIDGWQLRESGGVTSHYLTDALGSTVGLVTGTEVAATYAYTPFGGTTLDGGDGGNPYRYTGREDDGTGLYYYRARYYSPTLQRFISEDPLGIASGDANPYTYAFNQPTVLTDPMGLKPRGSRPGRGCTPAANSFTPDTQVQLADGSRKAIADVQLGDKVLATDPHTGQTAARPVTALITGDGPKVLVDISLDTDADGAPDDVLTATDGHPIWVAKPGEWRDAQDLRRGDLLRTAAGTQVQVTAVDQRSEAQRVHNLTVDDLHTYYVMSGDTQVLVHNNQYNCDVPALDHTGKLHGALPRGNRVPDNWRAEDLAQLERDLVASIQRRKAVNRQLGLDYGHAKRVADEEALLRDVRNRLYGK